MSYDCGVAAAVPAACDKLLAVPKLKIDAEGSFSAANSASERKGIENWRRGWLKCYQLCVGAEGMTAAVPLSETSEPKRLVLYMPRLAIHESVAASPPRVVAHNSTESKA